MSMPSEPFDDAIAVVRSAYTAFAVTAVVAAIVTVGLAFRPDSSPTGVLGLCVVMALPTTIAAWVVLSSLAERDQAIAALADQPELAHWYPETSPSHDGAGSAGSSLRTASLAVRCAGAVWAVTGTAAVVASGIIGTLAMVTVLLGGFAVVLAAVAVLGTCNRIKTQSRGTSGEVYVARTGCCWPARSRVVLFEGAGSRLDEVTLAPLKLGPAGELLLDDADPETPPVMRFSGRTVRFGRSRTWLVEVPVPRDRTEEAQTLVRRFQPSA